MTVLAIPYMVVVGIILELHVGLLVLSAVQGGWITCNLALLLFVHTPLGLFLASLLRGRLTTLQLLAVNIGILISLTLLRTVLPFFVEPDPVMSLVLRMKDAESFHLDFGSSLILLLGISLGEYVAKKLWRNVVG